MQLSYYFQVFYLMVKKLTKKVVYLSPRHSNYPLNSSANHYEILKEFLLVFFILN